ncbi:stonin-1 isoform X1 [Xenopus laevis]|uniref:Stonin-1 isoform X1 n=1 Tax=Xenopus laevis TaxID=8355 RepID=A0A8J0V9X7_XENLA|nr:stonin-1 isoform X1 [Xenopus laevis]XP_018118018.1 stonin-1 isoform X1 [Xenopus laevis]
MFSTKPENWVTFDDENLYQPAQKSLHFPQGNHYMPKANGLKLNLYNTSYDCSSGSNPTTPNTSPVIDFFMSPSPPRNTPLCRPNSDYSGTPSTPTSGSFILYPNSDVSRISYSTYTDSPIVSTNIPLLPNSVLPILPSPNKASTPKYPCHNYLATQSEPAHTECPQLRCAFSSPFWNNEAPTGVSAPDHERNFKETCDDHQKSLNQLSFSYVCEKLQHLKTEDPPDDPKHPTACLDTDSLSFIPHSLFRSERKDGWPFMLRIPEKKNMMSSRQWGPIYLKVLPGGILQMYYEKGLDKPFKEFQLGQLCRLSEPKVENFSVSDKIHTVKIEHVTYTEKRKYHPKLEVFHEAEVEQMLKLGTTNYLDLKDFITAVEEELMNLPPTAKQKKTYDEPEMIMELVDNFWGRINKDGKMMETSVICRLHCLCFVNNGTECFLTLNDDELQNVCRGYFDKVSDQRLIAITNYHFHKCVKAQEFHTSRVIKFIPVDACRLELMRFKTSFSGEELPFSVKTSAVVQGAYVELQAFLNMSPSFTDNLHVNSAKYCENIAIHFPVPATWMKALWTVSLQRQRSLKTKMNRRTCLGSTYETESEPVIQVTVGTAKYEKAYKAVVWRIDRLPDKNSQDQPHSLSCKLELGSDQEIPHDWNPYAEVRFVMAAASASGAEVKSVGIESDVQPHKRITHKACYNLQVEIERKWIRTEGEDLSRPGDCVTQ